MSTIHQFCSSCQTDEKRGFVYTGTIPIVDDLRCESCGGPLNRILKLSPDELSAEAEIAYEGNEIVVRESRWELLAQHILEMLRQHFPGRAVRRNSFVELPIREKLSLIIQPVIDHISHQEGCLLASPLHDAHEEEPSLVRLLLGEMNASLGEESLRLGTLRDLFPLSPARRTVFYRRFVDTDALAADALAERIAWVSKLIVFVSEAISTFGFSTAAVRFLQNLDIAIQAPPLNNTAQPWQDGLSPGFGAISLDELLRRTDLARQPTNAADVREQVESFLRALDIDAVAAGSQLEEDKLHFHFRGQTVELAFSNDDRDSYLSVCAQVSPSLLLDDELERLLTACRRSSQMGELCLRPLFIPAQRIRPKHQIRGISCSSSKTTSAEQDHYELLLRDTILGNDLNADELGKILASVTLHALALRDALGLSPSDSKLGASLDGLVSFLSLRAVQQSRSATLSKLMRRVCEFLQQLEIHPRLTPKGDLRLRHDDLDVTLHLGEQAPDSFLTIRAHLVELGSRSRREVLELISSIEEMPALGAFRLLDSGTLVFEDTILGNSLDLNELAKTLCVVVQVAQSYRPALLTRLGWNAEKSGAIAIGGHQASEGIAALYRRTFDESGRRQAVQAVAMFDDAVARECLLEAMRDPSETVAELATCGLMACTQFPHDTILQLATMALDVQLSDRVRQRALRVLGAAAQVCPDTNANSSRAQGTLTRMPEEAPSDDGTRAGPCIEALQRVALSESETPELRANAFRALGRSGSTTAVPYLVEGVRHHLHIVSHAALDAMVALSLSDPAPLHVAIQEALNRLRNRNEHDRATILKSIVQVGMPELVLEYAQELWEQSTETADVVAQASAAAQPPRIDVLRRMLAHRRGEIRRVAYLAIGASRISFMADDLADALLLEQDESLKPEAVHALAQIGVLSRRVGDALGVLSQDARLRELALSALHRLRLTQVGLLG
ncbi:MAG: HEAT repeat domain-containing protein [Myxococcota bacterium]|jgi:hypothetical protein|nr:HEAT repeat domain-containing protein [Myxococcota bacterium]